MASEKIGGFIANANEGKFTNKTKTFK